jgi:hypothetical protein
MVDLQGRQAQCPSPVPNKSEQRGANALTPHVVIDTDLINVDPLGLNSFSVRCTTAP